MKLTTPRRSQADINVTEIHRSDQVDHRQTTIDIRKLILTLVKVAVSGGLIYWILRGTDLVEIVAAIRSADLLIIVAAFLLHIFGYVISAYRWRLLLRTRGTHSSIPFLVESYIVGMFFNNLLPSTIGGDAYRAYDSYRLGESRSGAVAVVFVDRFLGLFTLMMFATIALLFSNELTQSITGLNVWVLLGVLGMGMVAWAVFYPPRWLPTLISNSKYPFPNKLRTVAEASWAFRGQNVVLIKALGLSTLLQLNVVLHYYLVARALDLPVPLQSLFLIVPLAIVITILPISVNGIGMRENVFAFFFAPFAVSKPEAVAFAWIVYGIVLLQGVVGGIFYAVRR